MYALLAWRSARIRCIRPSAVFALATSLTVFPVAARAVTSSAVSTNHAVARNNQQVQSCNMTVSNNGQSTRTSDCSAVMNALRNALGGLFGQTNAPAGNWRLPGQPGTDNATRRPAAAPPGTRPALPGNGFLNWTALPRSVARPSNPSARGGAFATRELALINQYRRQNGLNTLSLAPALMQLAQAHSQDMAARHSMDHNGFQQRFQQSGRSRCVENVAWNYDTPLSLFTAWRNSPEHNANMLDTAIQQAGIAIQGGYSTFFACSAN